MAKSVTSSYLSLDLFKYAVTGVAEKILKILIFFYSSSPLPSIAWLR